VSRPIATTRIVVVFAATPLTLVIMLVITPPSVARLSLHPRGHVPLRAHTHQPQNIHAIFQQSIVPAASVLVADCCVFLMLFIAA
jgi:hypothetical protein